MTGVDGAGLQIERPVTIAVTGAHSTGKSGFLARLASVLRRHDVEVATVADLGEQALRAGLPILHSHTYASTLWIMARGISLEIESWPHVDVLLVDRPVPDALAYYLAALDFRHEAPDPVLVGRLRTLAAQHGGHYDLVWRTVLDDERPLGRNKPRDDNARYRQLADERVGSVLTELSIPFRPLHANRHDAALDATARFTFDKLAGDEDLGLAAPSESVTPNSSGTGSCSGGKSDSRH